MISEKSPLCPERRKPTSLKKLRVITVILIAISALLSIALVFSLIVIDKLNKNNLFSKSIFLNNDYFLGSIARADASANTDSDTVEAPGYAEDYPYEFDKAMTAVLAKVEEYVKQNRERLEREYEKELIIYRAMADGSYDWVYDIEGKDIDPSEIEKYIDKYTENSGRMPLLLMGVYDDIIGNVQSIYWNYGICDTAHKMVQEFLSDMYGVEINIVGSDKKIISVPYLTQEGILPNGCEAVSATMLLQYAGMNISATDFVDNYLECQPVKIRWGCRYGPNPKLAYAGDPYSTDKGYGCYAPVIVSALNRVENRNYYAKNISGLSLSDIREQYLKNDIPVAVWVTVHMKEVSKIIQWQSQDGSESFLYPSNEHCMVLVGYDEKNYYFNDPYGSEGLVSYPAEDCILAFNSLGMQAVALIKTK